MADTETRLDDGAEMMRRLERDSFRSFVALVVLVVAVTAAGAFGYWSLRSLSQSTRDAIAEVRTAQDQRVAAQEKELDRLRGINAAHENAEDQLVAYLRKLAAQVKQLGGDPGTLVIHPVPSPIPSPSPS